MRQLVCYLVPLIVFNFSFSHVSTIEKASAFGPYDTANNLYPTILPEPTVAILGRGEKCDNDTSMITLSAIVTPAASTGNYSYEWYEQGNSTVLGTNANFNVSPTTATTYVVIVTDDGLATGSNSGNAMRTINVIGAPQLDPISDVTACSTYELPPITGTNISGMAVYSEGTNGSGNTYAPGTILNIGDFTTYPVTLYVYDESSGTTVTCSSEIDFSLSLTGSNDADPGTNVAACNSYTLPALSPNNSYWSNTGGTGTNYNPGDTITSDTTLFIYADDGNCTDENNFTVTINNVTADVIADAFGCVDYVLPTLSANNNYYTQPNGGGMQLNSGDSITTDSTLYIYAETGSGSAFCSDESSFTITISGVAVADNFEDVHVCDNYTLPSLSPNNRYFDQMGGTGTEYFESDIITTDITLYIYAGMPGCSAETDFNITLDVPVTVTELEDVQVCENYALPELNNGRYFTQPQGQGTELFPLSVLDSTQRIYIYNESGLCTAEDDFMLTIDCSVPQPTSCVTFPNFFTPNFDGANDVFKVYTNVNCTVNGMVFIYDRYGKLLNQFDAASGHWDGTLNGISLQSTDYWYRFIDSANGTEIKGHFTLKR